jgi:hypothetical protein
LMWNSQKGLMIGWWRRIMRFVIVMGDHFARVLRGL